jgi:ankyrin repeat protein
MNMDPKQLSKVSDYGTTPFHIACSVNQMDIETIEFLIQKGADINIPVEAL